MLTGPSANRASLKLSVQEAIGFRLESRIFLLPVQHVALRSLYRQDATAIGSDEIKLLLDVANALGESQLKRHNALEMLFDIAGLQPKMVMDLKPNLAALGTRPEDKERVGFGFAASAILARASYELGKADASISLQRIEQMLRTRTDHQLRQFGAYAAYLLWLDVPAEREHVEKLLAQIAAGVEPELRIDANMAREMIRVGTQTEVGPQTSAALALARLRDYMTDSAVHVNLAARVAMERWYDATEPQKKKH